MLARIEAGEFLADLVAAQDGGAERVPQAGGEGRLARARQPADEHEPHRPDIEVATAERQ